MAFHPKGQDLGDKDVVKAVHRQPRKAIGFAKDQAAAGKIRTGHNGLAIVHGIPNAALKKGLVKAVIGIIGKEADPDLGMVIVKPVPMYLPFSLTTSTRLPFSGFSDSLRTSPSKTHG